MKESRRRAADGWTTATSKYTRQMLFVCRDLVCASNAIPWVPNPLPEEPIYVMTKGPEYVNDILWPRNGSTCSALSGTNLLLGGSLLSIAYSSNFNALIV